MSQPEPLSAVSPLAVMTATSAVPEATTMNVPLMFGRQVHDAFSGFRVGSHPCRGSDGDDRASEDAQEGTSSEQAVEEGRGVGDERHEKHADPSDDC